MDVEFGLVAHLARVEHANEGVFDDAGAGRGAATAAAAHALDLEVQRCGLLGVVEELDDTHVDVVPCALLIALPQVQREADMNQFDRRQCVDRLVVVARDLERDGATVLGQHFDLGRQQREHGDGRLEHLV